MNYSAHFKCVDGMGIKGLGDHQYSSEAWDITKEEAEKLVGGNIYFHTTKNDKSYFGGVVTRYEVIDIDAAHAKRIKIYLTATKEAKGVAWGGKDHGMAWFSGIIER